MGKFFLPYESVPSINHYWLANGKKRFVSEAGRKFKNAVWLCARANKVEKINNNVAINLIWIVKDQRRRDLDNILKPLFDSLIGIAYNDDSQIVEINAKKYYSKNPKKIGVFVEILPSIDKSIDKTD